MADAALSHKNDAIQEGRRAVELLPVAKDSIIVRCWCKTWRLFMRGQARRSGLRANIAMRQVFPDI